MNKFIYIKDVISKEIGGIGTISEFSTPNEFLDYVKPNKGLPLICIKNKEGCSSVYLRRDEWGSKINDDESIIFVSYPMYGIGETLLVSLIVAVVVSVATYFLMPKPDININQKEKDISPTYDLSNVGNKIRLKQPIPVQYGRLRAYPDIASVPYSDSLFINSLGENVVIAKNALRRNLHLLLCAGMGEYNISSPKIDDTDLTTFSWFAYHQRGLGDPPVMYLHPIVRAKEIDNVDPEQLEKDESTTHPLQWYVLNDVNSTVDNIVFSFLAEQGLYVQADQHGLTRSDIITVGSLVNINISNPPTNNIGGWHIVLGDTVLLMGQTNKTENGVYDWNGTGNPMTRTSGYGAGGFVNWRELFLTINRGTHSGDGFIQLNYVETLGVDEILFYPFDTGSTQLEYWSTYMTLYAQRINEYGVNIGAQIKKRIAITGRSRDPYYFDYSMTGLTSGIYKVAVKYYDDEQETTHIASKTYPIANEKFAYHDTQTWIGVYGKLSINEPTFSDRTMIEICCQASGKLSNNNSGIFNFYLERMIDYFTGAPDYTTPAFGVNDSPVWALRDLLINSNYGAGLSANNIDHPSFAKMQAIVSVLGLKCNVRYDTTVSVENFIKQVCTSMRAITYNRGGKLFLARDQNASDRYGQSRPWIEISAFFSEENIQEGSFNIEWNPFNASSATWFLITYLDENTNKKETIECVLPGGTNDEDKKEEIELRATTNRLLAWKEGIFLCAQNMYRRQIVKFGTDGSGFLPSPMERISISHGSIGKHYSGYVQKVVGSTVYLSEPVDFEGYKTGLISFRNKGGSSTSPYVCSAGSTPFSVEMVKLTQATSDYTLFPFITQDAQSNFEATSFTFGVRDSALLAKVKSVTASGMFESQIEAVVEDFRVYASDVPEFLMPALGQGYIAHPELKIDVTSCIYNVAGSSITTTIPIQGYHKFKISYTFSDGVTETNTDATIVVNVNGETNVQVYNFNPSFGSPCRVIVEPMILISDVSYRLLGCLAKVCPITVT